VELERAVAEAVAEALEKVRRRTATVASFTASTVTVDMPGGGQKTLPYLKWYTPVAGHVVNIDCSIPDSWLVLGKSAP
jgi:hypothetical protein